jgi:hypothetical protein
MLSSAENKWIVKVANIFFGGGGDKIYLEKNKINEELFPISTR